MNIYIWIIPATFLSLFTEAIKRTMPNHWKEIKIIFSTIPLLLSVPTALGYWFLNPDIYKGDFIILFVSMGAIAVWSLCVVFYEVFIKGIPNVIGKTFNKTKP